MFVYVEVDRTAVPHSCCKKNQYGKYINLKKCQVWILGPPYRQSGQLNEAVFYKVFLFSYNVILQCSLLVPRLYVCIANILTFTLYLQPSSIRGLATSWIIFLDCLLSLMDLSKRSPVSPVHFVNRYVIMLTGSWSSSLTRSSTLHYFFSPCSFLLSVAHDHNKKTFFD